MIINDKGIDNNIYMYSVILLLYIYIIINTLIVNNQTLLHYSKHILIIVAYANTANFNNTIITTATTTINTNTIITTTTTAINTIITTNTNLYQSHGSFDFVLYFYSSWRILLSCHRATPGYSLSHRRVGRERETSST